MQRLGIPAGAWPHHLQCLSAAAQGRVVRHREVKPKQVDEGADQPFGLAQGQAEDGAQGQRRGDRQGRIGGLPPACGARLSPPGGDRFLAEPHGQAATLAQGGIVIAPVRHLVLLFGDVTATVLVQLERHGGDPGSGEGHISYAVSVSGAIGGFVQQGRRWYQCRHKARHQA
jgi:hypothetical protein